MIKTKVLFWRAGFFPTNQGFLKTFQIALIGWIKAALQKATFVLIIQANYVLAYNIYQDDKLVKRICSDKE